MGLAASCQVGSSLIRDQTRVPCIGRRILNYWTTLEVLLYSLSKEVFISLFSVDMKTAHSASTSTSFPLWSNSKRKYVLLVSFQFLISIHISFCLSTLCNHICRSLHCFDKPLFLFVLFKISNYTDIFKQHYKMILC